MQVVSSSEIRHVAGGCVVMPCSLCSEAGCVVPALCCLLRTLSMRAYQTPVMCRTEMSSLPWHADSACFQIIEVSERERRAKFEACCGTCVRMPRGRAVRPRTAQSVPFQNELT